MGGAAGYDEVVFGIAIRCEECIRHAVSGRDKLAQAAEGRARDQARQTRTHKDVVGEARTIRISEDGCVVDRSDAAGCSKDMGGTVGCDDLVCAAAGYRCEEVRAGEGCAWAGVCVATRLLAGECVCS